jgi:hypothetical protein
MKTIITLAGENGTSRSQIYAIVGGAVAVFSAAAFGATGEQGATNRLQIIAGQNELTAAQEGGNMTAERQYTQRQEEPRAQEPVPVIERPRADRPPIVSYEG